MFNIAPRLLINAADLAATGLVRPASRVTYRYLYAGEARAVADFRAAGTALSVNPIALIVPCHRIIKADGKTGGYGGGAAGTALKQRLLDLERPRS